jgi:hypothetical protein
VAVPVVLQIVDLHRRQLAGLVEIRGVGRMRKFYDGARVDLENKLADLMRRGRGQTFGAHHLRLVLVQVATAVKEIESGVLGRLRDTEEVARELAPRHVVTSIERMHAHFAGAAPVLQPRQVAVFQRAYEGVSPSLLDHHRRSAQLYGAPVIKKVRDQLTMSMLQGEGVDEAVDRVVGATGIVAGERYRAERIVRTESAYSYGVAKQSSMQALGQQVPRLMKRLVATRDDRTGQDSIELNGQTVDVDHPFVWVVKDSHGVATGKVVRYMQPPNRPNDREITIPWLGSWPASPALDDAGAVQPTTRGL